MAGGDKDGKTEKPTAKRLSEGRKEGRIARSQELVSWASIFVGISMIQKTTVKGGRFLKEEMNKSATLMANPDIHTALNFMVQSIGKALMIVLPLTILFTVLSIVGHLAQVRFILTTKTLKPSLKRLNPVSGIKKLFSMQSTFQAAKQFMKLLILGALVYFTVYKTMIGLTMNGPYSVEQLVTMVSKTVIKFIREVAGIGVIIGIADYFYSRKTTGDGLKMSKHEIKEESRQQDVAPEIKNKQRQRQRQMSRNRMMAAMTEADVVIVNPIHIAVALKYDPEKGAPRVLAKGAGFIAEKLREKAEEHKIPLVQDIPLARALHKSCEIDDEIPGALFSATARVLAFVFALKARGTSDGYHKMPGTPDVHEVEPMTDKELAGV